MVKYIGIVGYAGVGKDTLARELREHLQTFVNDFDNTCDICGFAVPLKDAITALFMIRTGALENREIKESIEPITGKTYRKLMQLLGTEFCRTVLCEDFFTKLLDNYVNSNPSLKYVIVPDVRFPDEAQFIRDKKGLLIKLIRMDNPHEIAIDHASEAHINHLAVDTIIHNNSTIEALSYKAEKIAEMIKNGDF